MRVCCVEFLLEVVAFAAHCDEALVGGLQRLNIRGLLTLRVDAVRLITKRRRHACLYAAGKV